MKKSRKNQQQAAEEAKFNAKLRSINNALPSDLKQKYEASQFVPTGELIVTPSLKSEEELTLQMLNKRMAALESKA
jgi:hypothetical protein